MYRSRLSRLEEKRSFKRMGWMALVLVGIVVVGLVWGVPLLVKVAMFAGAFGSAGREVDKSDLIPPAPPMLIVDFEATNSAQLVVRGWTEPGAEVFLTSNSEPMGSVIARDDGGFTFDQVVLNEGTNEFLAVAVDQGGNRSQPSAEEKVTYSTKAPKLEIEQPSEGQVVRGKEARVEVKGATDPGVRLTVNDRLVVVNSDGRFSAFAGLATGDNVLVIVAKDVASNQSRKEISVKYEP